MKSVRDLTQAQARALLVALAFGLALMFSMIVALGGALYAAGVFA